MLRLGLRANKAVVQAGVRASHKSVVGAGVEAVADVVAEVEG